MLVHRLTVRGAAVPCRAGEALLLGSLTNEADLWVWGRSSSRNEREGRFSDVYMRKSAPAICDFLCSPCSVNPPDASLCTVNMSSEYRKTNLGRQCVYGNFFF